MTAPTPPRRHSRHPLVVVWVIVGAAIVAVVALLASGRLNANVLPKAAEKPVPLSVECFDAGGDPLSGWSATAAEASAHPRVDPTAVCAGLYRDHSATATMDRIAAQQQRLGHDCVEFDTSDGEHWFLTELVVSPQGTYFASGGPAPGHVPDFGTVQQPAPLESASPRPVPAPSGSCAVLPTVTWDLSVPPMAACTSDGTAVSVYVREGSRSAADLCAAKGLVVAG
ncbi:hypothetical protein GCM10022286_04260 [Gryllotalpicola daejeonensis]|uniref:Uncharacterized protein n=1 Tax=Gryllotalpicola daejeonensis TaxID=993087 RepID=A0ABP7ZFJ4_9MICO